MVICIEYFNRSTKYVSNIFHIHVNETVLSVLAPCFAIKQELSFLIRVFCLFSSCDAVHSESLSFVPNVGIKPWSTEDLAQKVTIKGPAEKGRN